NEASGACETFLQEADHLVRIPMKGPAESLNASVAAGVLMFESLRQARCAGK
ncbi:MAG: RNA methyltransferase, partial [Clostridiales bacterium]|nr:RNA methyltransferase [Clostridiales bacterium]